MRPTKAILTGQLSTSPELRSAEKAIGAGQELQRSEPLKAIGYYLRAIELSARQLKKSPGESLALRDYDFALGRVFSVIRTAHLDPWTTPLHVPAPDDREYVLTQ